MAYGIQFEDRSSVVDKSWEILMKIRSAERTIEALRIIDSMDVHENQIQALESKIEDLKSELSHYDKELNLGLNI